MMCYVLKSMLLPGKLLWIISISLKVDVGLFNVYVLQCK